MPQYRTYNDKHTLPGGRQVLCCTVEELVKCGIERDTIYKGIRRQNQGIVTCWPYHKAGRVWLHYDGLKEEYRNMVKQIICKGKDPHAVNAGEVLRQAQDDLGLRKEDHDAIELAILDLPQLNERKKRMTDACRMLWLLSRCKKKAAMQKLLPFDTMKEFTEAVIHYIIGNEIDLPANYVRLKQKLHRYETEGAQCVIKAHNYGNAYRLKVDELTEQVLLSLFGRDEKPHYVLMHGMYEDFRKGNLQVTDLETGEIINHERWAQKPLSISTIYNWINRPEERRYVDKIRTTGLEYNGRHRPHAHRHSPVYSFSKITIDDIDVPFKLKDGKRVMAYQIYDVASGAVIGRAYSRNKNERLVLEAMRDMFLRIVNNGWGMPLEIETERHLTWQMRGKEKDDGTFEADLLTAGEAYKHVTFCRGGNPQQKRAEHYIKGKKYGHQALRLGFQRRPFAKLESNRLNQDKANSVKYTYEEVCRNEDADIEAWNNSPHPKYQGKTRWEVLTENQNPNLYPPAPHVMARYVGYDTSTSVQRNQYVKVKGVKYALPDPEVLSLLKNYDVTAYYITKTNADVVYLYQNNRYICECRRLETFNESVAEQTDDDRRIMTDQFSYIAKYDKLTREGVELVKRLDVKRITTTITKRENEEMMDEYDASPLPPLQLESGTATREQELLDEYDLDWNERIIKNR